MATDQGSSENQDWLAVKNWRNIQKEREREKRRMRDRERRQSMSLEERERHLARRRRNYQLRRQRALNNAAAKTGSEAENENNNLQVVSVVPELEFYSDSAPRFVSTKDHATNPPEARRIRPVKYPYPKGLHFYQIRHLARLLNSRSGGVRDHNQRVEAEVTDKNYDVPKSSGKLWRRIRLIDMKRLARALNSVPKGQPNTANNNSGERIEEVEGNEEQMICSSKSLTPEQSNEAICDVQQVNAYSGVFAP
nr:zinc finger CCCH domain-containing protein 18 isoform X2 [Ipomoea batatas]